jgi:flagellar basal body-associated protein FliL
MGLFTWIVVIVVVLAIIGLGWQTFFTGVSRGAEKVASSPLVRNVTDEAEEFVVNATENAAREIAEPIL